MTKIKNYDPELADEYLEDEKYEQRKINKLNKKAGLEGFGAGGNKSRNKRNKKETFRKTEEEEKK